MPVTDPVPSVADKALSRLAARDSQGAIDAAELREHIRKLTDDPVLTLLTRSLERQERDQGDRRDEARGIRFKHPPPTQRCRDHGGRSNAHGRAGRSAEQYRREVCSIEPQRRRG